MEFLKENMSSLYFQPLKEKFFFAQALRAFIHAAVLLGFLVYQFTQPLFLNADVWVPVYLLFFVSLSTDFFSFYFYDFFKRRPFFQGVVFASDAVLMTSSFLYLSLPVLSQVLIFVYLLQIISAGFVGGYRWSFSHGLLVSMLFSWVLIFMPDLVVVSEPLSFVISNALFLLACVLGGFLGTQAQKVNWFLSHAQGSLIQMENLNDLIVENIHLGIFITDEEDLIVYANEQGLKLLGLPPDFLGPTLLAFPELEDVLKKNHPGTFEVKKQIAGEEKTFEVGFCPVKGKQNSRGKCMIWFQDVSGELAFKTAEQTKQQRLLRNQTAYDMAKSLNLLLVHLQNLRKKGGSHKNGKGLNVFPSKEEHLVGDSFDRVKTQVEDFLAPAVSSQQISLSEEYLRVNTVLENLLEQVQKDGEGRDFPINYHVMLKAEGFVKGHQVVFLKIFSHIVSNSLQAMMGDKKGSLFIETFDDGPWVVVRVRDTGPGIKDKQRVFDPFYSTKAGSVGLGLTLVQKWVSHYGGLVGFEDFKDDTKGGALCVLRFPLQSPEFPKEERLGLQKAG